KQRVGIAQALLGNPEVLILDEPTVGLDPKQIIEIRTLIKSLSESHTVILSSHILPEIQAVCDRVIVINQGKLVADDTESNLSNKLSDDIRYTIRIDGPEKDVLSMLRSIPAMTEVQALGMREPGVYEYNIEAEKGFDIRREVFKRAAGRNWPIMGLKSSELTLEDIFLQLTEGRMDDTVLVAPVNVEEPETEPVEKADSEEKDGGDEE
ncbi:MAG: AAA family ATPase, partial [Clostridiales bacterium]|nr:AAA family ATPase [Clostridiales bacterium]